MRTVFATAFTIVSFGAAEAHIHLTSPLSRTDSLTGAQKAQHCGVAGQGRTSRVTVFQPGETITVTWLETINHPGHYRIAFQPDGDVFGTPPAGNGPPAGFPSVDETGTTDATGALILKDFIPDGMLTTQVTLPSIECTNCTLQFIQVMTDKPPYTIDVNSNDIYFNCADITLSATGGPPPDAGMPGPDAGMPEPEPGGGCNTSNGSSNSVLLGLGLGGAVMLRKRRRRF